MTEYLPIPPAPWVPTTTHAETKLFPQATMDALAAEFGSGGSGHVHVQAIPLSSWVIAHPLGRIPNVAVYLDGVAVDADVTATATTATITFPSPAAGTAVLS